MYGFDPSVLLQGRGVKVADPLDLAQRRITLQQLAATAQEHEYTVRKRERDEQSAQAIGNALGNMPDVMNDNAVRETLAKLPAEARAGFLMQVEKSRKAKGDSDKDAADTAEKRYRVEMQKAEMVGGLAERLAANPHPREIQAAQMLAQRMGADPSLFAVPEGMEPTSYFRQLAARSVSAARQRELAEQARGHDLTRLSAQEGNQTTARGQDLTRLSSQEGHNVTMRGQNMVNARSRESNAQSKWVNDLDRGVQVNMGTGETRPITASGQPIGPKASSEKLTETQSNATAFGMRMQSANDIINKLEQSGFDLGLPGNRYLPTTTASNYFASPEAQQAYQAKLNFMTATLRKESGAAINKSEFETEDKKYFPQPGDSAQLRAQKARARELALDAIGVQAGPGRKNIESARAAGSGSTAPKTANSGKFTVQTPDGQAFTFPTESAAFEFKQKIAR